MKITDNEKKNINCIHIKSNDLGNIYQKLGSGVEGNVYKYSSNQAIKIYNNDENINLDLIVERIKFFSQIEINNVAFPQGIVCNEKDDIIGYIMPLINQNKIGSFFNLIECKDNEEFINYFIKANDTMRNLHQRGIYVGDYNPNNIMIDTYNQPIFIDTINYASSEFSFLLYPYNSMMHEKIYGHKCSLIDNEKFMFTLLFLSYFTPIEKLEKAINSKSFKDIIDDFKISNEAKNILNKIMSDCDNKDYLDLVLEEFLKNEHKKYDNKFFMLVKIIFKN